MTRHFEGGRLVVASHNPGKVREIDDLLRPFDIEAIAASVLCLPEPVEDGLTFEANAILKAEAAATRSGLPALSDDSGLTVASLDGAPGIYSARWGGPEKDFRHAMLRVHEEVGDNPDRSAQFVCALALAWPDGHIETFLGTVGGTLVWPPRGDCGFGYDPMFTPVGYGKTFGEMDQAHKHEISHRADAFRKLVAACFETS